MPRQAPPDTWHPRGTPTWPDWKQAEAGQRVRHVRSRREGTFVKVAGKRTGDQTAVIDWDPQPPFTVPARGAVVAPAFDLEPVDDQATRTT